MITIHEENHLCGLRKLSKSDRKSGMNSTLEEFKDDVLSGFYHDSDCTGYWACVHDGDMYTGDYVSFRTDFKNEDVEWLDKPEWATHIHWYSK